MKDALVSTLLHVLAAATAIAIAATAWKLLGSDSELVLGGLTLAALAAEKLIRALPQIPVGDYVNDR